METLGDKNQPKISKISASKYYCIICDYGTSKKCNYNTHIASSKHTKVTNDYIMGQNSAKNQPLFSDYSTKEKFICSCGKEYHHRQGLWRHKKTCVDNTNTIFVSDCHINKEPSDKELILMLINQNKELLEIVKNGTHNTTNSNNTNSHNKSFNLQFFLNETCKNAMNITDFVNSLQLQLSDLEKVGELGYIEGISNIIIKNLNALDVTLRPVHCTDKKRETMYVKDENKWEKEDTNNTKLHKMVRKVSNKNIELISEFKEVHPDWKKSTSKVSSEFDKIIIESMGGEGDNDYEKEEKIIKKVAKVVFVDKNVES
jgi:hypothetical protein